MPWCDDCAKYWVPSSMNDDGSCPRCGTDLDEPAMASAPGAGADSSVDSSVDEKAPWHFKLMVVAVVGYLGWRFVEIGIDILT